MTQSTRCASSRDAAVAGARQVRPSTAEGSSTSAQQNVRFRRTSARLLLVDRRRGMVRVYCQAIGFPTKKINLSFTSFLVYFSETGSTNFVSFLPLVCVCRNDTQRLQSLPQTHVVTQHSMEVVLMQESQPVDALLLILPQLGLDRNRDLELFRFTSA